MLQSSLLVTVVVRAMAIKAWDMISVECGSLGIVSHNESIIRVCFDKSADEVDAAICSRYSGVRRTSTALLENTMQQLIEYFSGIRQIFDVPLNNSNLSPFAQKIYQTLIRIPYGSIVTYGHLAAMAGSPASSRATGRAMATNPFPILVPCHRVVNARGGIGFYSAANGAKTKEWLLDFESKLLR